MAEVLQYVRSNGICPFAEWFEKLDTNAAVKVAAAIAGFEAGNPGDSKSLGHGLRERRLHFDAGYRVYFSRDGVAVIVLLAGGTKRRENADIVRARQYLADYLLRKKEA